MKRQKKRQANEHAKQRALSAGKLDEGKDKKSMEGHGIMEFLSPSWRHAWLWGLFIIVITLIAYGPAWHAGFIWDDDSCITDNPAVKSADGLSGLWLAKTTPDYYPMTFSLFWLEWRIWAENPLGYHLVNILLHALSAVLLWRVLQHLKIPGAILAAAIFALHPINVESAAWVAEGKNTLCMVFYLGALLCWLKFEDSGRRRWYGLALAVFAFALFSKSAVAPLPIVLLGIAWWRRGRVTWKDVRQVVPFFVIAGALCSATVWFHYHRAIGHTVIRTDGFWSRLAGAGWAVWFYLYKALLPLNLIFVYPRWQIDARNMLSYVPLALLAAAFFLFWFYRRRWGKALFFGLAYFVVMLLPILGFLNIYFMRYSLVADHWEYFAIIGPIALASAGIELGFGRVSWGKSFLQPVLAATLLLVLGVLTWKQCGMYANSETLWQTTLHRNPDCWMARNNLGIALVSQGQTDVAISQYREAIRLKPDYADAHNNLGDALTKNGQIDEAIHQYQEAIRLVPDDADIHSNLGTALLKKGQTDEAISQYQEALRLKSDHAEAHNNLGAALFSKGQTGEAISQFQEALRFKPDYADARNNLASALGLKKAQGKN